MTDDETLDRLLVKYLAEIAAGREADPAADIAEQPSLASQIREVWELARDTSPRRRVPRNVPTFAGYEIQRELGAGGMGHVYLARHVKLGRTVALKVLPHRLASSRARERFAREARSVARLEHPLIVPVFDLGEEGGQPYFTMQYVPGRTLAAVLASVRGRDPATLTGRDFAGREGGAGGDDLPASCRESWWYAAARAAIDVAEALAHAHEAGVVHRDVKPSNVMMRDDGSALLFDFGLASMEDGAEASLTQGFVGTPHYASPEQAAGTAGELDARTDVFSLGASLYEALTLQPPFFGPNATEILRRIQTWEPDPPSRANPSIPRALETVVLAALEKDPDARYRSAAEMAHDLRAALEGSTIRAKRAGILARGLRAVKRNRAVTELLVERQALRSALMRAEKNEQLAREREEEARAARERADAEREKSAKILEFLEGTLSAAHPDRDGRDVRVIDVLDRAATQAGESFAARPDVLRAIRRTLASTLCAVGELDRACELARRAFESAARDLPEHDRERIVTQRTYAEMLTSRGRYAQAIILFEGADAAGTASAGADDPDTIQTRSGLAACYAVVGRRSDAARLLRENVTCARRALGPDHRHTIFLTGRLGRLEADLGNVDAGLTLAREACELWSRIGAERSIEGIDAVGSYARLLVEAGRNADGLAALEGFLPVSDAVLGQSHPISNYCRHWQARALASLGRLREAADLQRTVVERDIGTGRQHRRMSIQYVGQHVRFLLSDRRYADAEGAARDLLATAGASEPGFGPGTSMVAQIARAIVEQGHHADAEPILLGAWHTADSGIPPSVCAQIAEALVLLYESWGRPERADEFRAVASPAPG